MSQARESFIDDLFLSSSELADWYAAGKSHPEGDFFEEIIEGTYRQILQQGDSALDCGAHRGRHTFAMLEAVGSSGYVVGAEALPMLAASLSFELANRGELNCTIFPMAIGEKAEIRSFQWVREAEAYSGLLQRDLPRGADKSVFPIEVPVFTLDTLAAFLPKPARFMKMDLEGGEFHALQGGRQMLSLCRCFVVLENGRAKPAQTYSYSKEDWFGLFDDIGYAIYDLFGRMFGPEQWESPQMPWYVLAVAKGSDDERYVQHQHPLLVRRVYRHWLSARLPR